MDKFETTRFNFANRTRRLKNSAIRAILKVTENPETISFAGGLPAPSCFPVENVRSAFNEVLLEHGQAALQYSCTEGYYPLRQWISEHLDPFYNNVNADTILIVSGSQQALDLLSKIFIDEDSSILIENPSYIGALQSFNLYNPNYVPITTHSNKILPKFFNSKLLENARFLYILPNFQNPTGRTLDIPKRINLLKFSKHFNLPIIEDDPYGDLRYTGNPKPSLFSLSKKYGGTVIRLGSFSKILAPGLRLGYIAANEKIINKLVQAKQATDLNTSTLTQMAVYKILKTGFLEKHLANVRKVYREQSLHMLEALNMNFPKEVKWTKPEGGMFIWVTLPKTINSNMLLKKAIEKNVTFVPGESFYSGQALSNTFRLSFSTASKEDIYKGISILGNLLKEEKV